MILPFLAAFFLITNPLYGQQKKINLEDVKIQGEGVRRSQLSLSQGDRTDLEKHLTIRKDFRKEIIDELPPELESKAKVGRKQKKD